MSHNFIILSLRALLPTCFPTVGKRCTLFMAPQYLPWESGEVTENAGWCGEPPLPASSALPVPAVSSSGLAAEETVNAMLGTRRGA